MIYFLIIFFLSNSLHAISRGPEIIIHERVLNFDGIYNQFIYQSTFDKTNIYTEDFKIKTYNGFNNISINTKLKKTTIALKDNYDIYYVQYEHNKYLTTIKKKDHTLTYISNNISNIIKTNINRLVIFPEFQLRDFIFSDEIVYHFYYLLDYNYKAVSVTALKTYGRNTNYITLTIDGINGNIWKMIYYYDDYAWITRKEGFFNSKDARYISVLKYKNPIIPKTYPITNK